MLLLFACGGRAEHNAQSGEERPETACGPAAGAFLTGGGVGALRIGRTVAELASDCEILADSIVPLWLEGLPQRVVFIPWGSDTLAAEVVNDRIWRLSVRTPRVRTADSVGVGTTLSELLTKPGVAGLSGEGALFVVAPSYCGLSFGLGAEPESMIGAEWTLSELASLSGSTPVRQVLVFGCPTE